MVCAIQLIGICRLFATRIYPILVYFSTGGQATGGSGLLIEKQREKDLVLNLLILALFKYYHFFVDSFIDFFSIFGSLLEASQLPITINRYQKLANEYPHVEYLNWMQHPDFVQEDFFDADHPKHLGAIKLSRYLNDFIKAEKNH